MTIIIIIIGIVFFIIAVTLAATLSWTAKHVAGAMAFVLPSRADPYRALTPDPEPIHDADCEGCDWLQRYGRWQPPEVILTAGLPIECLMREYGKTREEMDQWARDCGLTVQ